MISTKCFQITIWKEKIKHFFPICDWQHWFTVITITHLSNKFICILAIVIVVGI